MESIRISVRQKPVLNNFSDLLDQAKAVAAAISDNAIEDQQPLPRELLQSFVSDLYQIKAHLETAFEIHIVNDL
tara:strand:- start:357 stop:578 length:222 start_codon:yes stop_codon:yes gene_type:complete